MADNVTVDTITGTPVVASDDIAGVQYQRIKLIHGINGTNDGDVSTANPLPVGDAGGSLTVDDGGTSLTVDGTVEVTNAGLTALNGAISGTEVQVDVVTMPTVAVTGTFYQATQPVSIASAVPVTDNSGTLTVDDGGLSLTVDGTVAATQSGTWNVGTVTAVTGVTNPVAVTDNAGSLTVDAPVATPVFVRLSDGSSAISTLPVSLASVPSHAVTNAGTFATQVTSISAGDNNIGNVDVVTLPALPAGTNNIGDVDILSIAAGSNLIGDVALQGRTTGGLSIFRSIDLDETEEEVKATAGTLYSIDAMNMTTSPLYLKVYDNTAAGTTVGTTTPVLTYVLPTNGDTNGCGMVKNIPQGLAFATGITVAVTTGLADDNTGAPAANAAIVNIGYK